MKYQEQVLIYIISRYEVNYHVFPTLVVESIQSIEDFKLIKIIHPRFIQDQIVVRPN